METLEIESQTNQTPLTSRCSEGLRDLDAAFVKCVEETGFKNRGGSMTRFDIQDKRARLRRLGGPGVAPVSDYSVVV